jgi:hypothetical protein
VIYKLAADLTVFLHFLWIVFLLFGAFIGRKYRALKYLHIAGLCFAVIIQIFRWYCPLTHLEIWFRQKHDPSLTYRGSFLIHYVERIVYLELTPGTIFVLTAILIAVSAYLYKKGSKKNSKVANHMKYML